MRRLHLRLASPAALAAALLLAPPPLLAPAMAQAFLGTPTIGLGNVNRVTGPGNETITIDSPQAIINWVPNDTATGGPPIDFLPGANSAVFQSANGAPYTVLNRIIAADPSRAIALNGLVSSDPIGNVWFYAPGGLLIGGQAQFDVGGLLLTANDPVGAAAGTPFIGAANDFRLAAAANSAAAVTISGGATIQSDSYLIAVAPSLSINGSMSVGAGNSAAFVAAEDVSFTLNGGLFDIAANVGTAAGGTSTFNGIFFGPGGIGGQGVYSRLYMMAVPRNVGMTLLITGSAQLGFDIANAADVDGNAIVLSGGYDIVASPIATGTTQFGASPVAGAAAATIVVENSNVTSNLALRSNDTARVLATSGNTAAAANVEIYADSQAVARASNGFTLSVAGDLRADASALPVLDNGQDRSASQAIVLADTGGDILVTNNILAFAIGTGEFALSPGLAGGSGFGGTARVTANGPGSAISAQSLFLDASGLGGVAADGAGGNATGGFAELRVVTGGSLTVNGSIDMRAQGLAELGAAGRASGSAQGGGVVLELEAGTSLSLGNGGILLAADGLYAESSPTPHLGGETARGGVAEVRVQNGATLNALGLIITADAAGPAGGGGNSFVGGSAGLLVNETSGATQVTLNDDVLISAEARATDGASAGNAAGGSALGGQVQIASTGGASVTINGQLSLIAQATGGASGGGTAGLATGGSIFVGTAGTLSVTGGLQPLLFNASGVGGDGGGQPGSSGTGGSISIIADPGATLTFDSTASGIALFADGEAGASGILAGNALGGQISLTAEGTITLIGNTSLSVNAFSGFAPVTGTATAGDVVIVFGNTGLIDGTGSLLASAQATGRTANGGTISLTGGNGTLQLTDALGLFANANPSGGEDGASGTGGTVTVTTSNAGQFTVGGVVELTANAVLFGAGAGASLTGGTVNWQHRGTAGVTGSVTLSADAGYLDGGGGIASGGSVTLDTLSGSLAGGGLIATASAAAGGVFAAPAAAGTGGSVTLTSAAGSSLTVNGEVQLLAEGRGASLATASGPGGTGRGGSITLITAGDTAFNIGGTGITISAAGTGGGSELGPAGSGRGGSIQFDTLAGGNFTLTSGLAGPLVLDARGIGDSLGASPASVVGGSISIANGGDVALPTGLTLLVGGGITGGSGTLQDVTAGSASLAVSSGTTGIGGTLLLDGGAGSAAAPLAGNGIGGTLGVTLSGGTLNVPGDLLLQAAGVGGSSGTLPGGNGTGGTAALSVAGATLGVTGTVSLIASGTGGDGASGGTGQGGAVTLDVGAGSLFPIGGQLALGADGQGGGGFSGPGGAGTGGSISLAAFGGGRISAANPLLLGVAGVGGTSQAGTGGAGTGGTLILLADGAGSQINLAGATLAADGSAVAGGDGNGGLVLLDARAGGLIESTAALGIAASGLPAAGGNDRSGVIQLLAEGGGQIRLTALDAVAGGTLAPPGGQRSGLVATAGSSIAISGDARLATAGDLALNDGGSITVGAYLELVTSGQLVSGLSTATPGATGTVTAGDLLLDAGGGITLATALATTSGDLGLLGGGPLGVGTLTSARHAVLLAGGNVSTGGIATAAGGTLFVGDIAERGLITFVAGAPPDYAALLAGGQGLVPGNISIVGPFATDAAQLAATGSISLSGAGQIGTDLFITAGGDAAIGPVTLPGTISLSAGGRASLTGPVAAQAINISSTDIVISGGQIGGAGTQTITLFSEAPSTVIGGAGTAGAYSLSNAEFGALRAGGIFLSTGGSMRVEQLALAASQTSVSLAADGLLSVVGAVTAPQAAADSLLGLSSSTGIAVVQGSGSIQLGSDPAAPAGTLDMAAPFVRVATQTLLDQIAAGSLTGAARDRALNAAQPVGTPAGTIGAGTIRIAATQDVLIQNSGDARTRAGFTAGLGGLEVTAGLDGPISGGALLDVVINGRVQQQAGGFATNNDTRDAVRLVPDAKAFTATSAVNGCVFGKPCASGIEPELIAVLTGIEPLTLDELEGRDQLLQPMERLPLVLLQRLFDFGPLFSDVDATDPVTSGGNPALWLGPPPEPKAQP